MFKCLPFEDRAWWNKANSCTHIFLIYLLSVHHPESSSYITNTSNFHFKMNRKMERHHFLFYIKAKEK